PYSDSPGGFEGLRANSEVLLLDHQPPSEVEELKHLPTCGHAAARSVPPQLNRDKKLVSQVEELLGVELEVLECIEPISGVLEVPVMAIENRMLVRSQQVGCGTKFDLGIKDHKVHGEAPRL